MSKINQLKTKRRIEQNRTYLKYKNFALDVFRWENLPNGIESRDIENMLYEYGKCYFYKSSAFGLVCLPYHYINELDIYGHHVKGIVRSENGILNEQVVLADGVEIFNNDLKTPTRDYISDYAERMSETELAIKSNISQQRFPYMIPCNRKNQLSLMTMYQQVELGAPAIFHADGLDTDSFQVLNTTVPYIVDKLNAYRYELERELLTYLGINNSYEKKERVIVDEVNSNNEYIYRNIEIQFKNRQRAVERINELFGTDIKIVKVSDIVEEVEEEQELQEELSEVDNLEDNDLNILERIKKLLKGAE